jgi:isopentenyl phosphate kinase
LIQSERISGDSFEIHITKADKIGFSRNGDGLYRLDRKPEVFDATQSADAQDRVENGTGNSSFFSTFFC